MTSKALAVWYRLYPRKFQQPHVFIAADHVIPPSWGTDWNPVCWIVARKHCLSLPDTAIARIVKTFSYGRYRPAYSTKSIPWMLKPRRHKARSQSINSKIIDLSVPEYTDIYIFISLPDFAMANVVVTVFQRNPVTRLFAIVSNTDK